MCEVAKRDSRLLLRKESSKGARERSGCERCLLERLVVSFLAVRVRLSFGNLCAIYDECDTLQKLPPLNETRRSVPNDVALVSLVGCWC